MVAVISAVTQTWYFDKFRMTTQQIIAGYFAIAALASVPIGLLMPYTNRAVGAVAVGMLGGVVVYGTVGYTLDGKLNLALAIPLGTILGGVVGFLLWFNLRVDAARRATAGSPARAAQSMPPPLPTGAMPNSAAAATETSNIFSDEESALLFGDDAGISEFIDWRRCMVVDWRSEEESVLEDAKRWLPPDLFSYRMDVNQDGGCVDMTFDGRTERVLFEFKPGEQWRILSRLDQMLRPKYAIKLFTSTQDSDTLCFLVRPEKWWAAFRERYPDRYRRIFADFE